MNLTAKDFGKCRFDPMAAGEMILAYTELWELMVGLEVAIPKNLLDKLLRYVVILYDEKSPVVATEPNIKKRKEASAIHAGFDIEADDIVLQTIYTMEMPGIVDLATAYLFKFCKPRVWTKIVVNEQLFQEYAKRLLQPVNMGGDGKGDLLIKEKEKDELQAYQIKAKLREELDSISVSLDGYYKEMFGGDDILEKAQRKMFTPEEMAMR